MRSSDETRPQDIIFLFCFCFKPKIETHAHHSLALLETSVELLHRSRSVFFNLHSLCQMAAPGGPSTDTPPDLSLLCVRVYWFICLCVTFVLSWLLLISFQRRASLSFTEPLYMRLNFPACRFLSVCLWIVTSLFVSISGWLSFTRTDWRVVAF